MSKNVREGGQERTAASSFDETDIRARDKICVHVCACDDNKSDGNSIRMDNEKKYADADVAHNTNTIDGKFLCHFSPTVYLNIKLAISSKGSAGHKIK